MERVKGFKVVWAVGLALVERVAGLKIVWAVGLALALLQFSLLGIRVIVPGAPPSVWSSYLWPWLSRVLVAGLVIITALVTAVLIRPQRPERLAAAVGAVGGMIVCVLPELAPHLPLRDIATSILAGLWAQAFSLATESLRFWLGDLLSGRLELANRLSFWFWDLVLPLTVSCWIGANYWRSGSWRRFWRAPGGAILKGGLVAGAVGIPLSVASSWWRHAKIEELMAHMPGRRLHMARPWLPGYPWIDWIVASLSGIAGAAVVTALLVSWRPKPLVGAFAGIGLTVGLWAISLALLSRTPHAPFGLQTMLSVSAVGLLKAAIVGGIAGSFAGRWEENWNE
jgi:hypothetical protein